MIHWRLSRGSSCEPNNDAVLNHCRKGGRGWARKIDLSIQQLISEEFQGKSSAMGFTVAIMSAAILSPPYVYAVQIVFSSALGQEHRFI